MSIESSARTKNVTGAFPTTPVGDTVARRPSLWLASHDLSSVLKPSNAISYLLSLDTLDGIGKETDQHGLAILPFVKVIFCCVPQTGHLLPLLPLANAFAAQGDEVIVASGPEASEIANTRGLSFSVVGPSFDAWFGALRTRTRGMPGDGLDPSRILGYFVPRLFGEVGTALMIDDLIALCSDAKPDLIVFDPYAFAAPLAAAKTGTRAVLHNIGPLLEQSVLDLVADAVSPMWRELGLDVPRFAGVHSGTTLTICPLSLDASAADLDDSQPLRPVPLPLPDPAALPIEFETERPLIYLTLGTFSNNDVALFHVTLDALRDEDVNVVATIGRDNDPAMLDPLPENARVERFIPQAELLPHCSAVIHHAGAGTSLGVLAHGLPALALPQSADNFVIAELLAKAGVARTLMPEEVSEATIRSSVRRVVDDADLRQRAGRMADDIASMPSAAEVAELLRGQP
jgi:UDP-N-acetylglucosamine:LPS N-acetylglucosamine transferase